VRRPKSFSNDFDSRLKSHILCRLSRCVSWRLCLGVPFAMRVLASLASRSTMPQSRSNSCGLKRDRGRNARSHCCPAGFADRPGNGSSHSNVPEGLPVQNRSVGRWLANLSSRISTYIDTPNTPLGISLGDRGAVTVRGQFEQVHVR
jgi:hypothetical protein